MKKPKDKKKKKINPIDDWVEANIESLILKPGVQKLFGIKEEEAIDFVAKRLVDERAESNVPSAKVEPFKIIYTQREILELARTLEWKGTGTENDPIIIPSDNGLPQKFLILNKKLFIRILDCSLEHIIQYNCQNISIENSSFEILEIIKSSRISVKNSIISKLNLEHCSNSLFQECSIAKASNLRSSANIFEDCTIANEVRSTLQEEPYELTKLVKQIPYILVAAGFGIAIFTFIYIFSSIPFGLYWYLSIFTFIGFIILYIVLSIRQKNYTPNKFIHDQNFKKQKGVGF